MSSPRDIDGTRPAGHGTVREVADQLASLRSVLAGMAHMLPAHGAATGPDDDDQRSMRAAVDLLSTLPREANDRLATLAAARFTGVDRSAVVRVHLSDACTRMTVELAPGAHEIDPAELAHCIAEAHVAAADQFRAEQRHRQEWLEAAVTPVRDLLQSAASRAGY